MITHTPAKVNLTYYTAWELVMKRLYAVCWFLLLIPFPLRATSVVSGIISSDTTWTAAGSPYQLSGTIQVAYGKTLTIAAGASVVGGDQLLEIFGNLVVAGTQGNPVSISNLKIAPGGNSTASPSSMDIHYANIDGGSIWSPRGIASYSSLSIRDSLITNLGGEMIYLWYPVTSCTFERNTFIKSCGFSIGIDVRTVSLQVTIRNNVFFNPQFPSSYSDAVIACWASYGGTITVDANSFLNITGGYALKLPAGYSSASITAANNYWGGLDTAGIAALIYDKTKDLNSAGTIPFQPIRQSADPATPIAPTVPSIVVQPSIQTIKEGGNLALSVTASGYPAISYQWMKDGAAITGATSSTLSLNSVSSSNAGIYTVVVTNAAGSVTSSAAILPVNVPPAIATPPASQSVKAGEAVAFAVTATGTPGPTFQWQKNGTAIAGATSASYTIANALPADAGSYTCVVTNAAGSVTSAIATLTVNDARLFAISCRAVVGTGGDVLIPGIIVSGSGSKQVIVRASGPALMPQGVTGTLAQPQLRLYNGSTVIAENIGWSSGTAANTSALQAAFTQAGLAQFPTGSADCALLATLTPGVYTAIISGANNSTGVALVEVYELGASSSRLSAISCRAVVGTGGNVLIPGIIVSGSSQKRVIVRASGPALIPLGVTGTLAQPQLRLYSGSTVLAENIGWSSGSAADTSALQTATVQVGLTPFPAGSADCALLATLTPGAYTAIVSGANNTTGVALIEVYEVP